VSVFWRDETMSAGSEYAKGLILINGRAYPANEVLQALERQAMTSVRAVNDELWIGKQRVHPLAKITPEQAMKLTCFGSLAYCCDLNRECHLRDEAIRLLGISKEEFRAIQLECHQQFLRYGERRWPQEQMRSTSSEVSHSPSFSRSASQSDQYEAWREPAASGRYDTSRSTSQASRSGASSTVDLGGLFGTPEEYKSRSFTEPDPFSSSSSRLGSESRGFSSGEWSSSGSTIAASPSSHSSTQGFCIYCGQDLQEDSEFCSRCGRNQK